MIQFICHSIIISIAIAIYAMFARECYLAIKEFIHKPDWRDKVISRNDANILEDLRHQELHCTEPFHNHHDGCPECDMARY